MPADAPCWTRSNKGSSCPPEALAHSRAVLREIGNVSSATLPFVLARVLTMREPGPGMAMAFGPGLVAETFRFSLRLIDFSSRSAETEWMDTEVGDRRRFRAAAWPTWPSSTPSPWPGRRRWRSCAGSRAGCRRGTRLSVLDVGFGEGDMLRRIARWGARRGLALELEGVDLNPASAAAARAATPPGLAISYPHRRRCSTSRRASFDVVISSLFTHHLTDAAGGAVLGMDGAQCAARLVHQRPAPAPLAYYGFAALSRAAGWHRFVQHDGPISVARSFQRRDWTAPAAGPEGWTAWREVRWHMPFRFCVSRMR